MSATVDEQRPAVRLRLLRRINGKVILTQIAIVVVFLAAWQWLPTIKTLSDHTNLLNSFFISSPSRIAEKLGDLFTGTNETPSIWSFMWPTVVASLAGLLIGMVTGGSIGLILGSSRFLSKVFTPFVVAVNAIPRIALVPIVVIIFGPTLQASIFVSVMIVFFVVLFNAYEGAQSPPSALLQNAVLMGANRRQLMVSVRGPYARVWILAALPVSATFSIISVVTGEILTGYPGLGRLVSQASSTADATLTFAVVIVLAVLGLLVVGIASLIKARTLHWWADGRV